MTQNPFDALGGGFDMNALLQQAQQMQQQLLAAQDQEEQRDEVQLEPEDPDRVKAALVEREHQVVLGVAAALTRTSTSVGPGVGTSICSISSCRAEMSLGVASWVRTSVRRVSSALPR